MQFTIGISEILVLMTLLSIVFPAGYAIGRLAQRVESQGQKLGALEHRLDNEVAGIHKELRFIRRELTNIPTQQEDD